MHLGWGNTSQGLEPADSTTALQGRTCGVSWWTLNWARLQAAFVAKASSGLGCVHRECEQQGWERDLWAHLESPGVQAGLPQYKK